MTLFFGDSYTSGENNNTVSWVNYIGMHDDYVNNAISGTTMGDYSLYPVKDHDLLHQLYQQTEEIKKADRIVLAYGLNDIAAVATGYTKIINVKVALIKCLDYIKQINFDCVIDFVIPTLEEDIIHKFLLLNCDYITNRYLHICPKNFAKKWKKNWTDLFFYMTTHSLPINNFYNMIPNI